MDGTIIVCDPLGNIVGDKCELASADGVTRVIMVDGNVYSSADLVGIVLDGNNINVKVFTLLLIVVLVTLTFKLFAIVPVEGSPVTSLAIPLTLLITPKHKLLR